MVAGLVSLGGRRSSIRYKSSLQQIDFALGDPLARYSCLFSTKVGLLRFRAHVADRRSGVAAQRCRNNMRAQGVRHENFQPKTLLHVSSVLIYILIAVPAS
jgi:hypothetical protein